MNNPLSGIWRLPIASFVFVHGAWHGGWCWHRIVARLQHAGHRALAPDLAGLGRDRTPAAQITLAGWVGAICGLIDESPEPVILVGHSRGGIVISEVAEHRPDRIGKLVYVTAFLLPAGESLQTSAAVADPASLVGAHMVISEHEPSATLRPESLRDAFYGQCSDEDVILATSLLTPEPLAPLGTPLQVTDRNFGRVPRAYVECTDDRAITIAAQRAMQVRLPCAQRFSLESDHSPFLSCPDALAAILLQL